MTKIIGGTVSYEDARKHTPNPDGSYPLQRKVRVELTFETDAEVSDPAEIGGLVAGDMAKAEVIRLLDGKAPEATVPQTPAATDKPKASTKPAPSAAKRKATSASATAASSSSAKGTPGPSDTSAQQSAGSDTPSDDDLGLSDSPTQTGGDAAEDLSEFDVTPADDAAVVDDTPKEVTDADLNSAVTAKNAKLQDAPKIRGLIAKFNPDPTKPFKLAEIAQKDRAKFLTQLEALK